MYLNALIPFELRHIGKPFLIRFLCMELAVQQVFSKILRVLYPSAAATVIILHSGAYISGPTDAQYSLVIDIDTMVMTQIVIKRLYPDFPNGFSQSCRPLAHSQFAPV